MPDLATLLLFASSVATLVLIPGPNLIYMVTLSAEAGRRAGLASILGIETGTMIHVAAAEPRLEAARRRRGPAVRGRRLPRARRAGRRHRRAARVKTAAALQRAGLACEAIAAQDAPCS